MRPSQDQRFAQLRKLAIAPTINHNFCISPLIDHFVSSTAQLLGISKAEFWRRLAIEALEEWLRTGQYTIPEAFRSLPPGIRNPPLRARIARKYLDSDPPPPEGDKER